MAGGYLKVEEILGFTKERPFDSLRSLRASKLKMTINNMIKETLIALSMLTSFNYQAIVSGSAVVVEERILAKKELNLTNRLPNPYGNEIFSDNILLSLHYLKGDTEKFKTSSKIYSPKDLDWGKIRDPFEFSFTLKKGEVFAFHRLSLEKFENSVVVSTNSKFIYSEGYKSVAGLAGNGVCHIASLINWTAKEAGLEVISMIDHDFAPIPDIPREFGASIYSTSKEQNLYIRNNFDMPVTFKFVIDNQKVALTISS